MSQSVLWTARMEDADRSFRTSSWLFASAALPRDRRRRRRVGWRLFGNRLGQEDQRNGEAADAKALAEHRIEDAKRKALGPDAYIVKPFSTDDLVNQVRLLLGPER